MEYYCVKQHDITDCAAACLATICKQHGCHTSVARIREAAGTDTQGTNVYGIVKAAEQLGFRVRAVKGDREAFMSGIPLPCIAHMIVDGNLLHYVVVHKIEKDSILIADPGKGKITKLTPDEFFGIDPEQCNGKVSGYYWTGAAVFLLPSAGLEQKDENTGIIKRFLSLLKPQKTLMFHIFLASIVYTLLGVAGAFYFKVLLDVILPGKMANSLQLILVGMIVLCTVKVLLGMFRSHLLVYLSQRLDIDLILGYFTHVVSLPMSFFGTRRVGEITSRFGDASNVRDAISGATLTIMIDTVMVVIGGSMLFAQNPVMFGITLLIVLLYIGIVMLFRKQYEKRNQNLMEDNARLTSYLVESLNGMQTVKAYNAGRKVMQNTEKKFASLLRSIFKLSFTENMQGTLKAFVETVGGAVILWTGAAFVMEGTFFIGQLITFNALLVYFLEPLKNLIDLQPRLQTAFVAAERLSEILDLTPEEEQNKKTEKVHPEELRGNICFHDVKFRYGTREPVLENFHMKIGGGKRAAIVGESGAGKTTIAKLLMNFFPLEGGSVTIGDYDVQDIDLDCLRDKIAYIPQETFLYSGSVLENLTLGRSDCSMEEVIHACKMAQAHDFINELSLRYQTLLEENGANLSGGQRQRLAIARALLKKADIMVLDEATSNLDSIAERAIENTLQSVSRGLTTLIIAHRLSTIRQCDTIIVLEKGKIVEQGTFSELMGFKKGSFTDSITKRWRREPHETHYH